jgi:hypothetical protein
MNRHGKQSFFVEPFISQAPGRRMNVSDATSVIRHLNIDFARELSETRAWSFRIRALSR